MSKEYNFFYGAELEACDIDCRKGLPEGFSGFSKTEYDLVSSSEKYKGLPNDPSMRSHTIGGELNTIPTKGYESQLEAYRNFNKLYPEATVNHRIDMHLHISHDSFKDIKTAKRLLTYFYENSSIWMDRIYPKNIHDDMTNGDRSFSNITSRSMSDWRYKRIMNTDNMKDFIFEHKTDTKGVYNPRMGTRYYINMISLEKHGSIEVRANYPSLEPYRVRNHYMLITNMISDALSENPEGLNKVIDKLEDQGLTWNKPPLYNHYIQCSWRYCAEPQVGWKYMRRRWKEFKKLWEEDSSRFYEQGWWNKPFAIFDKSKYETKEK